MKLSPKQKQVILVSVQVAVSILLLYLLFNNVDLAQAQESAYRHIEDVEKKGTCTSKQA